MEIPPQLVGVVVPGRPYLIPTPSPPSHYVIDIEHCGNLPSVTTFLIAPLPDDLAVVVRALVPP
jgi:hypothetical protein